MLVPSRLDSFKDLLLHVTAEELEVATGGFDEEHLLGSGGTSKVYKATVLVVAVKKFHLVRKRTTSSVRNAKHWAC